MHYVRQAVRWAKKAGLYVIMDLHALPGRQSTESFSGDTTLAVSFFSDSNYNRAYDVLRNWTTLAHTDPDFSTGSFSRYSFQLLLFLLTITVGDFSRDDRTCQRTQARHSTWSTQRLLSSSSKSHPKYRESFGNHLRWIWKTVLDDSVYERFVGKWST